MESKDSNLGSDNTSKKTYRVLYADTDRMGVVYHGTYFRWFEAGRANYMRLRGAPYIDIEKKGIFLPVVEAHAEYLKPANYDDVLTISVCVSEMTRVQIVFSYSIAREDSVLVRGFTRHAAVDDTGRPVRIPKEVENALSEREIHRNDTIGG